MKNYKNIIIKIILVAGLLLVIPVPSSAQTGSENDPAVETAITLADGMALDVTYALDRSNFCFVSFVGDGIFLSFSWYPGWMEQIKIKINNGDSEWPRGENIISLDNGWSGEPWGDVVDLSALPPDYRELWETCMVLCGDLLESDEFWKIINTADIEKIDEIRETLEYTRDGYYPPHSTEQFFKISFGTSQWLCNMQPGRCYSFEGPISWRISTPNVIGEPDPEIYIDIYLDNTWTFHFNAENESVEASMRNTDPETELGEEDYMPVIERLIHAINFSLGQEPFLIENGLISQDDDYGLLLNKALDGLTSWPIEIVEQSNPFSS